MKLRDGWDAAQDLRARLAEVEKERDAAKAQANTVFEVANETSLEQALAAALRLCRQGMVEGGVAYDEHRVIDALVRWEAL